MSKKDLQLVNFTQAKRLKKLGFDWETMELYHEDGTANIWMFDNYNVIGGKFSAPSVPLTLKWFRDEKGIKSGLAPKRIFDFVRYAWWYSIDGNITATSDGKDQEAAESALLDELLSIFEKEKE
jgi:hypothetical protein